MGWGLLRLINQQDLRYPEFGMREMLEISKILSSKSIRSNRIIGVDLLDVSKYQVLNHPQTSIKNAQKTLPAFSVNFF